jgi:dipeptidyl aminopeptidase/acylaminoacyl peptidase
VTTAPYGSWPTPFTSASVVADAVRLGELAVDGADVLWSEGRPAEGGRTQLVRSGPDGACTDLLTEGYNARTAVHEYGGGAWWARKGVVWFANWADQRLYRLTPGTDPMPLTPEPATPRADRFADGDLARDGGSIVCVRERHHGSTATEVDNEIVRLDAHVPSDPEVLVTGSDFVAAPRLSPDGASLAWLRWNHPQMPWEATELVVRNLDSGEELVIAGGPNESVLEPRWGSDGALWFVSDRTNWWNLYRYTRGADIAAVVRIDAEIGFPPWGFGSARYAMHGDGSVVLARAHRGYDGLARLASDGTVTDLDTPFTRVTALRAGSDGSVLVVAGSPTQEPGVHRLDPDGSVVETLRPPRDLGVDPRYISLPEHITFPTEGDRTAHALFYPPAHPDLEGPDGQLPPLIVAIHGGPTAAATPVFSTAVQYWTSRGFGLVDVNYRGSTGYGRAYREELAGQWGIADVADCLSAARYLARTGRVDAERLTIRGGSAGGFTTLAALARADTPFAAGSDHFGVADLEALARDTHKFESRYLDGLVGPYPAARERYVERSPIHHVDQLNRPLIVLQGSEDAVVPPAQSELIVNALRASKVPVAYLLFDGEQHGFRRAENIRAALDAELSFYAQVLGFVLPADEGIEPVVIENL